MIEPKDKIEPALALLMGIIFWAAVMALSGIVVLLATGCAVACVETCDQSDVDKCGTDWLVCQEMQCPTGEMSQICLALCERKYCDCLDAADCDGSCAWERAGCDD